MKPLLSILFMLTAIISDAQESKTQLISDGKVGISIYYEDMLINVGSNKLKVIIDQETNDITIRVNPSTFLTGIDSLDTKLQNGIQQDVVFKGNIGSEALSLESSTSRHFEVEGELTLNDMTLPISLSGSLREGHQGMGIDGMLYLHYDINLPDFGLDRKLAGFADYGCIEVLQPLKLPESRH